MQSSQLGEVDDLFEFYCACSFTSDLHDEATIKPTLLHRHNRSRSAKLYHDPNQVFKIKDMMLCLLAGIKGHRASLSKSDVSAVHIKPLHR
jgi:hypothetical protein